MSFPSVNPCLEKRGLTANTASPQQIDEVTLEALYLDLPEGMEHLRALAATTRARASKLSRWRKRAAKWIDVQDPDSALGRQLTRLMSDVVRQLVAKEFGIAFGFYNCCNIVCAPKRRHLRLSVREQVKCQNGELAYANC